MAYLSTEARVCERPIISYDMRPSIPTTAWRAPHEEGGHDNIIMYVYSLRDLHAESNDERNGIES